MKKGWIWLVIGLVAFVGWCVGFYFYVKKSLAAIAKSLDEVFPDEQNKEETQMKTPSCSDYWYVEYDDGK